MLPNDVDFDNDDDDGGSGSGGERSDVPRRFHGERGETHHLRFSCRHPSPCHRSKFKFLVSRDRMGFFPSPVSTCRSTRRSRSRSRDRFVSRGGRETGSGETGAREYGDKSRCCFLPLPHRLFFSPVLTGEMRADCSIRAEDELDLRM